MSDNLYAPLPECKYDIVLADPPWSYGGHINRKHRKRYTHVSEHYPTLTFDELKQLPILDICADDCLLFMWATSPNLDIAMDLGRYWGFKWATVGFVWIKNRPIPGYYTMGETEQCLIWKRGKIPHPRGPRNIRQVLRGSNNVHSQKPEEVRRRIDTMFPKQKKIELFARQEVRGWDTWGNQISP